MKEHAAELATVMAMLTESRKALEAGKTEEGLGLLSWAETELGRYLEASIDSWWREAASG
jgi:hypothetical protein